MSKMERDEKGTRGDWTRVGSGEGDEEEGRKDVR